MDAIRVESLKRTFKTKVRCSGIKASVASFLKPEWKITEAVNGISLTVQEGEVVAFLGPNGAGKSTTIKMLTGILTPDSGTMSVLGLDPSRERVQLASLIGSVFGQKSQLWFHLPPDDSFSILGAIYDIPKAELARRRDELVSRFALGDLMKVPVRKLSLGERVRCELAASLIHKPRVLFLDEPTIGLDVVVKQEIRKLLSELNRDENVTIFLTSHDIGDIEKICKRAVIIHHGAIVVDETMKNLKHRALGKKIVSVKYADRSSPDIPGLVPVKRTEDAVRYEVDTKRHRIEDVIRALSLAGEVADITVEDEPLENLIADVFRSGSEEEAHEKAGNASH